MLPVSTKLEYISTAADELDDILDYSVSSSGEAAESILVDDNESESDLKNNTDNSKKRKSTDDKLHSKKKLKMEHDCEQKKILSLADPETIAEKLASKIAQQNKDLSPLELGELYISKNFIRSSADFKESRTLDNLTKFIKSKFLNLITVATVEKPKKKKKTPKRQDKVAKELAKKQLQEQQQQLSENSKEFVAIISMSAIRACDTYRATKELGSMKLIKKNKLKDDLDILEKSPFRVLATTPNRIVKIMNEQNSPIDEKNIKVVVLDNTYLDLKKQNVLDIAETILLLSRLTSKNPEVEIYLY